MIINDKLTNTPLNRSVKTQLDNTQYKNCPFNQVTDELNRLMFLDPLLKNRLNIIRRTDNFIDGDKCKMSHRVGTTANCEFVSSNNTPYSGLWKGCYDVLIRISLSTFNALYDSDLLEYYDSGIGVGLKFFRDKSEENSADIVLLSKNRYNFRDDFKFESNL